MLEVLVVLTMLSAIIATMVGILGNGSANRQAENNAMKLMNDFSSIEMAFNNYRQEKQGAIPVSLGDATFVPVYLFPPKADIDKGFTNPTSGTDGYLLGSNSNGNYICAQAGYSDTIAATAVELQKKVPAMKVIVNSGCPSTTTALPANGTVSFTYWILRTS